MGGRMGASPCIWADVPGCRPANGYRCVRTSGLEGRDVSMRTLRCTPQCTPRRTPRQISRPTSGYIPMCTLGNTPGSMPMRTSRGTSICTLMCAPRWAGAYPGVYGHTDAWMGPSGCIHRGALARKYRRTGTPWLERRWENGYGNR